ncbi:F-box domain-containing protein [Mycena kentingensis (nom. inval.)]|nr:F-box domain-containing protein [Mycena kentingensis (nom. inval.)]
MDLSHLLHSNSAPTEAQTRYVRQLIVATEAQARQMNSEHAHAATNLGLLKGRVVAKQKEIADLRRVVSVVRHLPPEILAEIFSSFVHQSRSTRKISSLRRQAAPIVLTRVCARWRAVALATPRIWSELRFSVPPYPGNVFPPREAVEELVRRAHPHPMTIYLGPRDLPQRIDQLPPPTYTSHIPLAVFEAPGFVPRVGDLSLSLAPSHFVSISQLPPPTFASLRSLRITLRDSTGPQGTTTREILSVFQHLPVLSDLRVIVPRAGQALPYKYSGPPPSFPWGQLEHLEWRCSLDARIVHAILAQATSLRTCSITLIRYYEDEDDPIPDGADTLPRICTLPHLEDLTLHGLNGVRYPPDRGAHPPRAYLPRHPLTSLKLIGGVDFRHIPRFLENNPTIAHLTVKNQDLGIFAMLRYRPSANATPARLLLPNLRSLSVSMRNDDERAPLHAEGMELAEMLSSRTLELDGDAATGVGDGVCMRLQSVYFKIGGFLLNEQAEGVFKRLVGMGVLVEKLKRVPVPLSEVEEEVVEEEDEGGESLDTDGE